VTEAVEYHTHTSVSNAGKFSTRYAVHGVRRWTKGYIKDASALVRKPIEGNAATTCYLAVEYDTNSVASYRWAIHRGLLARL
jgi:hypothetical protein